MVPNRERERQTAETRVVPGPRKGSGPTPAIGRVSARTRLAIFLRCHSRSSSARSPSPVSRCCSRSRPYAAPAGRAEARARRGGAAPGRRHAGHDARAGRGPLGRPGRGAPGELRRRGGASSTSTMSPSRRWPRVAAVPGVESALLETIGPSGRVVSSAVGLSERRGGSRGHRDAGGREPARGRGRVRLSLRRRRPTTALRSGRRRAAADRGRPRRDAQRLQPLARRTGLDASTVDEIEQLAGRATPALWNARRFTEAQALADLDPLTRLHNRRYFHELLEREVARAHRYRRRLSLLVLDVDDFAGLNAGSAATAPTRSSSSWRASYGLRCEPPTSRAGSATTSSR